MAKGFTTTRLFKGKEALLRQMVCEVRYLDGHLYLDHCGRLLRKLIQSSPEWIFGADPTPKGTAVFHLVAGVTLSFSMHGASLDLNKTGTDEFIDTDEAQRFAQLAEDTLGLVFDELEVQQWSRIGVRELYYFPCESKADAERWLKDLSIHSVSSTLAEAFSCTLDAVGFSALMEGEDCSYRIAVNGMERSAQVPFGDVNLTIRSSGLPKHQQETLAQTLKKQRQRQINSAFATVLDIDAFRINPVELDVAEFIRDCTSHNLERFRSAIPPGNGKKGR